MMCLSRGELGRTGDQDGLAAGSGDQLGMAGYGLLRVGGGGGCQKGGGD
jgi:hypothetical protein